MNTKSRLSFSALIALSWVLLALALLSGCVTQSVHPIYDSTTLVFEDRLVGTWQSEGDGSWILGRGGARSYELVWQTGDEGDLQMEARLVQLGETRFLDIYFDDPPEGVSDLASIFMMPLHTILRVDEIDDELRLSAPKQNWIKDYLKENPDAIRHTFADGRAVLTDDTAALQRFYSELPTDADVWEEVVDMRRVVAAPAQP